MSAKKLQKPPKQSVDPKDVEIGKCLLIVLGKYPPWPAMVVPESRADQRTLKQKHKGEHCVLVQYLPTREFQWARKREIYSKLDAEMAQKYLDDPNINTKGKDLQEGYKLVADNVKIDWFGIGNGKDVEMQEDEDEEEEEEEEEGEDDGEKDDEIKAEEAKESPKKLSKLKRKASVVKASPKKKSKPSSSVNGSPLVSKSQEKPTLKIKQTSSSKPQASAAEKDAKRKQEQYDQHKKEVLYLRHRLQKALKLGTKEGEKSGPPSAEEMPGIKEQIAKLQNYSDVDVEILKNTKIHKVLKRALNLDLPLEEELGVKALCSKILDLWKDIIDKLKHEEEKNESPRPESKSEGTLDKHEEKSTAKEETSKSEEAKEEEEKESTNTKETSEDPTAVAKEENTEDSKKETNEEEEKESNEKEGIAVESNAVPTTKEDGLADDDYVMVEKPVEE